MRFVRALDELDDEGLLGLPYRKQEKFEGCAGTQSMDLPPLWWHVTDARFYHTLCAPCNYRTGMRAAMTVRRLSFVLPLVVLALTPAPAGGAPSVQLDQDSLANHLQWPEGPLSLAALTRALAPALRHRIPSELLRRASPSASARSFLDDGIIYEDIDDTARYHDADKRQYPDYGHLRFGKRAEFSDYGHLGFGRSQDTADRQDKDNVKRRTRRLAELKTTQSNLSRESR
ncbi:hypothetical protein FHG87_002983 [Trinorchestia longiramus]|nr:hypothetical protein FHG87_002983 [Trinorchestia longiramus]